MARSAGTAAGPEAPRGASCLREVTDGLLRWLLGPLADQYVDLKKGGEIISGGTSPLAGKCQDLSKGAAISSGTGPQLAVSDEVKDEQASAQTRVVKTLYLVRHGEAVHNVLEKQAQKRAATEAEKLGHPKGSEAYDTMLEMARLAVLHDANQADPGLSDAGKAQALDARVEVKELATGPWQFPEPTGVLVSPLFRTLQTAAAVFPEHSNVRVHGLVRERRTGLACDELSPQREMCLHSDFTYMDFSNVLEAEARAEEEYELAAKFASDPRRNRSDSALPELEDKQKLRRRTAQLAELLLSTKDDALCLVTHKGYLRELERGPLGRPKATEFGTCEVRIYEVCIGADSFLEATLRYCRDLQAAGITPPVATTKDDVRAVGA